MQSNMSTSLAEIQARTAEARFDTDHDKIILDEVLKVQERFTYGLGTRIEVAGQAMRVIFTCLDSASP